MNWRQFLNSRKVRMIAAFAGLALLYTNCSGGFRAQSSSSQETIQLSGNGTGYDGKTFVEVLPSGSTCPDLTHTSSRVDFVNGLAVLTRENCVDLPPAQQRQVSATEDQSNSTLSVSGIPYFLETFTDDQPGKVTNSPAGQFAPAMSTVTLKDATYVQATALDSRYVLVSLTAQAFRAHGTSLTLKLFERTGLQLREIDSISYSIGLDFLLSDWNSMLGIVKLDDSQAVLFVRSNIYDVRALLVKRSGDKLSVTDDMLFATNVFQFAGTPLNDGRALIAYRDYATNPAIVTVRTLRAVADKVSPIASYTFTQAGTADGSAPVILPTMDAAKFQIVLGNTNTANGEQNLKIYPIAVSATAITSDGSPVNAGSTEPFAYGLELVGDSQASVFVFNSQPSGYRWGRINNGVYTVGGLIDGAAGHHPNAANMLGAGALRINGRSFFRLSTPTGTRIFYFDSLLNSPQAYNRSFARQSGVDTSVLLPSGDKLILVEPGFIRVLGTP